MIGRTLSLYIASRFTRTLVIMVVSLLAFIVVVDFIDQLRKAAEHPEIPVLELLKLSSLKAPVFLDKAFPFASLFAAMITLTQLNLRLELVVARAAGVSAWQFLMPVSAAAVVVGLFASLVYNPLAVTAFEMSKDVETAIFDSKDRMRQAEASEYWLQQEDKNGSSIINARIARDSGRRLDDVRILRLDEGGRVYERIDAADAELGNGEWTLHKARVMGPDAVSVMHDVYRIESDLTERTVAGVTAKPDSMPVWELPEAAELVSESGANPGPYLVQFHSLLAMPLFLVAMVLIAATVSLRFVRFGQVGRMILGGVVAGFVLYTITKLVTSLGSNGIVPPAMAAWSPSVVAIVFGISILLHQEDG